MCTLPRAQHTLPRGQYTLPRGQYTLPRALTRSRVFWARSWVFTILPIVLNRYHQACVSRVVLVLVLVLVMKGSRVKTAAALRNLRTNWARIHITDLLVQALPGTLFSIFLSIIRRVCHVSYSYSYSYSYSSSSSSWRAAESKPPLLSRSLTTELMTRAAFIYHAGNKLCYVSADCRHVEVDRK